LWYVILIIKGLIKSHVLTVCCSAKALEVVGMALSRGADINARNNFGDTPIHSRKERYDPDEEVLDLFVRNTKIGKSPDTS
jgi:hypothetical protein